MPSRLLRAGRRVPRLLGAMLLLLPAFANAQGAGERLRASIADALVVPTDRRFASHRWEKEPAIVALYFGADWCGPCHAFVPELKRIHAALKEAGADTEVVYVSLDESEGEMRRYMRKQQMPWPAIDYRRLRAMPAVKGLAGLAPPNLVLVDREGEVIASGWHGRRYAGLKPVLEAWAGAVSAQAATGTGPVSRSVPEESSP